MAAPLCVFCLNDPMVEKLRVPQLVRVKAGADGLSDQGTGKYLVVYQCDQCKRIEAVTE